MSTAKCPVRVNLEFLVGTRRSLLVRIPLIKGITDQTDNIERINGYIKDLGNNIPVEYLDYNPLAAAKYKRLSIPFLLERQG